MSVDLETMVCPQCGSNDITVESEHSAKCNSCGSEIAISQHGSQIIYNIYNLGASNDEEDDVCEKEQIHVTRGQHEFMRGALISLLDENTPLNIYDSEFSEPILKQRQILKEMMAVDISYTVSVGHDRKETYTEYVKVSDGHGGWQMEPRTRTRTVTDWTPFNGQHSTTSEVLISNDEESINVERFEADYQKVSNMEKEKITGEVADNIQPNGAAHEAAANMHAEQHRASLERSIPGDHHRDLSYNRSMSGFSSKIFVAPEYSMSFKYGDETYVRKAFAFGGMQIGGSEIRGGKSELSNALWAETKQLDLWSIGALAITLFFVGFLAPVYCFFWYLTWLMYVGAVILYVYAFKKGLEHKRIIQKNFKDSKIASLNRKLLQLNLSSYQG